MKFENETHRIIKDVNSNIKTFFNGKIQYNEKTEFEKNVFKQTENVCNKEPFIIDAKETDILFENNSKPVLFINNGDVINIKESVSKEIDALITKLSENLNVTQNEIFKALVEVLSEKRSKNVK